ncbi:MAG: hypothetical protein ACREDR_15925, partial [Blastocatellia bacterium]
SFERVEMMGDIDVSISNLLFVMAGHCSGQGIPPKAARPGAGHKLRCGVVDRSQLIQSNVSANRPYDTAKSA